MTNSIDRALRNIVLATIFFTPFLPFLIFKYLFFPFITTKVFAFRVAVQVGFAAYAILAVRKPEYRPRWSRPLVALSVFIGILFLSDIFGVNPYRSFWSNYERMEGFVTFFHLYLYALMVSGLLTTHKLWNAFWNTTLFASLVQTLFAFIQLAGFATINQGGVRVDGTFGNAAYLAIYTVAHIFIALFAAYKVRTSRALCAMYGTLALMHAFVLYHTATRGSILGLFAGFFVAGLWLAMRGGKTAFTYGVGAVVGIVFLVGAFFLAKDTQFVRSSPVLGRFASISLTEQTTESRFLIWRMSVEGFKERPLLGWGQDNYQVVFNKFFNPKLWKQEVWFDRSHNVIFDWLVAAGALGLLAYLSLYGSVLWAFLVEKHKERESALDIPVEQALLLGGLVAYFVHNFFVFDNLVSYLLFFTVVVYAGHHVEYPKEAKAPRMLPAMYVDLVAAIVVVALPISMWFVNIKPALASQALLQAIVSHSEGPQKNLEYFRKLFAYNTSGSLEGREQLIQTTSLVISNQAVPQALKQEFLSFAVTEMEQQVKDYPYDTRYPLFLGMLITRAGSPAVAMPFLEKAQALSPKKQLIAFEIVNALVLQKEYARALAVAKEAYDWDPEYPEAARVYVATLMLDRKFAEADRFIKEHLPDGYGDAKIVNALLEVGAGERAIQPIVQLIARDPQAIEPRFTLASLYYRLGNKAMAISILQRAVIDIPSFKEQGTQVINQLNSGASL